MGAPLCLSALSVGVRRPQPLGGAVRLVDPEKLMRVRSQDLPSESVWGGRLTRAQSTHRAQRCPQLRPRSATGSQRGLGALRKRSCVHFRI